MVSAFSFGIRQNEQKKEADKAAEVEKAEFFCEINTKNSEKILELDWTLKGRVFIILSLTAKLT